MVDRPHLVQLVDGDGLPGVAVAVGLLVADHQLLAPLRPLLFRRQLNICTVTRTRLEPDRLIPDCSPFSDPWMSTLYN